MREGSSSAHQREAVLLVDHHPCHEGRGQGRKAEVWSLSTSRTLGSSGRQEVGEGQQQQDHDCLRQLAVYNRYKERGGLWFAGRGDKARLVDM